MSECNKKSFFMNRFLLLCKDKKWLVLFSVLFGFVFGFVFNMIMYFLNIYYNLGLLSVVIMAVTFYWVVGDLVKRVEN